MQQTRTYRERSRDFLAGASEEFANGDMIQASGKAWEAAVLMITAVAETRGWNCRDHRDLAHVVDDLATEAGDVEINKLFIIAGAMETNYYENWNHPSQVEVGIARVTSFVEKLENILDRQT